MCEQGLAPFSTTSNRVPIEDRRVSHQFVDTNSLVLTPMCIRLWRRIERWPFGSSIFLGLGTIPTEGKTRSIALGRRKWGLLQACPRDSTLAKKLQSLRQGGELLFRLEANTPNSLLLTAQWTAMWSVPPGRILFLFWNLSICNGHQTRNLHIRKWMDQKHSPHQVWVHQKNSRVPTKRNCSICSLQKPELWVGTTFENRVQSTSSWQWHQSDS